MQTIEEIHIGEIIKHVMKEQGRSQSWLAKKLGCDRAYVYDIYKRQYIDTHLLQKVSIILNHDFFRVHSAYIINLNHIQNIDKNSSVIMGFEKIAVPIAQRRWPEFKRRGSFCSSSE